MSWLGDKTQARMNRPLRHIKGRVCFFHLSNDGGIVQPSGASLFFFSSTPCRHEKRPQRSKYGVSAGLRGGDAFMGLSVGRLSHCRLLIQRGVVRAEGSWGLLSQTLIPMGELCRIHPFWSHKIVPKPNFSHDLAAWPWCTSNVITKYCWNCCVSLNWAVTTMYPCTKLHRVNTTVWCHSWGRCFGLLCSLGQGLHGAFKYIPKIDITLCVRARGCWLGLYTQ